MKEIIENLKQLIIEGKKDEAQKIYREFTEEQKIEFENLIQNNQQKYINIEGHEYSGFNLFCLSMEKDPGIFGTFNQWRSEKRKVKKGSNGYQILVPIFGKDEKEIRFFKSVYIFAESDTEILNNNEPTGEKQ